MPQIKEFVDTVNENPIPGFDVQYLQGAPPVLHLYGSDGAEAAEPISISQWNKDQIIEFLEAKIDAS